MKIKILFVDDEVNVLNGTRRMLNKMRKVWDMDFIDSGTKAMEALNKTSYHVVVSDMRMPGMDGAELLENVRQLQPKTLRIILSGYTEEETILRTVGPAHQYLAKPCAPEVLIKSIRRGLELKRFVDRKEIRAMISGLGSLPTPPSIIFDLIAELESPNASGRAVAKLIADNIALTAQILRLTNSAFFTLPIKATSPLQAVSVLGLDAIRAVVLKAGIFENFKSPPSTEASLARLSLNCLAIGDVARALAKSDGAEVTMINNTQCAGILSHLGTILLMVYRPELFFEAAETCEREKITIYEAETKIFDVGHAELGAYLLGLWGFADPIVEAVACHHTPGKFGNTELCPLTYVHAAQYLCSPRAVRGNTKKISRYMLDLDYLKNVGVTNRLDDWKKIAETALAKETPYE